MEWLPEGNTRGWRELRSWKAFCCLLLLGWYLAVEVVVCTVDDTAAISK